MFAARLSLDASWKFGPSTNLLPLATLRVGAMYITSLHGVHRPIRPFFYVQMSLSARMGHKC
jgi:hypothetical protein